MIVELLLGLLKFKNKQFKKLHGLFEELSNGQHPETLFITCSDSRIVPSLLTQADPGELFNIRNPGNLIPPYPIESSEACGVEYALKVLNVKDIIICGHSQCGAIKGLLTPGLREQLPSTASWLKHAHRVLHDLEADQKEHSDQPDLLLEIAIKKNIIQQIEHLKTHPAYLEKAARNELRVHGWYYDLGTGKVFIYQTATQEFVRFEVVLRQEAAYKEAIEMRQFKIISELGYNYLNQLLPVKSETQQHSLEQLVTNLQNDIHPIWEFIKATATKTLWTQLGDLYTSHNDPEFLSVVEACSTIF